MSVLEQSQPADRLELKEITGPSAVGGGWRRFWELLWLLSATDFKKAFFGTILGYLWSLVRPLVLFAVLFVVFTKIFKLGSGVPNYPVLLLFNIVLFTFFQEGTTGAVGSVLGQEGIVRKTQFPRLAIPLSVVMTAVFNLGLNMVVVVAFILAYGVDPTWTWLLLPLALLPLVVLTSGVALLLSALNVRFRDVAFIWTVFANALFYMTPVLYTINVPGMPQDLRRLLLINPLTPILEQARAWVIDPSAPGAVAAAGGWLHMIPGIAIFVGVCVAGVWVFRREAPKIAEML
ncbi:MAG TPA: ABC transporter permease [Solirubrobacterales bacterium]|jgi:ABC-2 type transport system permease protein|nr:ABC transporter permease [Solirubrobacterales bacterium]